MNLAKSSTLSPSSSFSSSPGNSLGWQRDFHPQGLKKLCWVLLAIAFCGQVFVLSAQFLFHHDRIFGLVRLFDLDREANIPTLISCFLWWFAAVLSCCCGQFLANKGWQWTLLAAVFAFLGIDEFIEIHEMLGQDLREYFHLKGALRYAGIFPFMAGGFVFAWVVAPWLLRLPRRLWIGMVLAGIIYVAGAGGVEMICGLVYEREGDHRLLMGLLNTLQEMMEILAVVLLNNVLLDALAEVRPGYRLSLGTVPPIHEVPLIHAMDRSSGNSPRRRPRQILNSDRPSSERGAEREERF